jgi:hypothetical protein
MPNLRTSKAGRHKRAARPETRLVLPPARDGQDDDDVLKSLIDAWLVPRLVDEFVRERALDLSRGCAEPSDDDANGENCRAA